MVRDLFCRSLLGTSAPPGCGLDTADSLPIRGNGHIIVTMKKRTIPAGQFKAECLRLIDQVADTREPLVVTKRGRPVVEVVPIRIRESKSLRGSVTVQGDIVGPILDSWDVDR